MAAPLATLAVLTYDGRALLDQCLPSVLAQKFEGFEVVVVDNGSSDGTVEHVQATWPQVRLVALEENVGVTAALNAMVDTAESEFVALLNNDVELEPTWLPRLIDCLRTHPEAAAAAGKLLGFADRACIDRAGDELHWSSAAFGRGAGQRDRGQFETAEEIFAVGGAAALYRRDAFTRVGRFDDAFFAYLEDVDWGFRARLAGFTARYEPTALGYHMGGGTLGEITPFSLYHLRRNQLWLVAKNYPLRSLVRHAPEVLWFNLHAVGMAVRRGRFGPVGRAYRDAVLGLPGVMRRRRKIQAGRTLTPAALEGWLE